MTRSPTSSRPGRAETTVWDAPSTLPHPTQPTLTGYSPSYRRHLITALVCALWVLTGCGDEPDLLAHGAREIPGTLHADYLTARPFSVSPDARMLVFAKPLTAEQRDGDVLDFDRGRLTSFRLLDLDNGTQSPLPDMTPAQTELLERYGLLHEAPCWHSDSSRLLFRTRYASYLEFGPLHGDPVWSLDREAPAGLAPGCGERPPPFVSTQVIGRFRVERNGVETLRVHHAGKPGVLLEVRPDGLNTQINVGSAVLSPRGDRLALVYSEGVGSFSGRSKAVVVSARDGDETLRPLGGTVLIVDWIDEDRLVGYARPDGRREYALFTWTLDVAR